MPNAVYSPVRNILVFVFLIFVKVRVLLLLLPNVYFPIKSNKKNSKMLPAIDF